MALPIRFQPLARDAREELRDRLGERSPGASDRFADT